MWNFKPVFCEQRPLMRFEHSGDLGPKQTAQEPKKPSWPAECFLNRPSRQKNQERRLLQHAARMPIGPSVLRITSSSDQQTVCMLSAEAPQGEMQCSHARIPST